MKTDIKPLRSELITHMDGATLVVMLRATMPSEITDDFVTALRADDAEVRLRWAATGTTATMTTGDGGRVIAEFGGSDRD